MAVLAESSDEALLWFALAVREAALLRAGRGRHLCALAARPTERQQLRMCNSRGSLGVERRIHGASGAPGAFLSSPALEWLDVRLPTALQVLQVHCVYVCVCVKCSN